MTEVFLGLGSNLGDREANLLRALKLLMAKGAKIVAVSPLFDTEPVGYLNQPRFLNAACQAETNLDPPGLLRQVQVVEAEMGRTPSFPNAPRIIDIDILFYGDQIVSSSELEIPHPRLAQRAFVLVPLASIAPGFVHPLSKRTVRDLLQKVETSGVQMWGP
ncbi:MAG: 2-amino-4-hydroxy-6-hydroxymethyldihydropteridine diphosphokinase, partial [Chloroflexi bacterium]|nr:2-amino-4-hydroxy-6-hydroxymethyldihydropteridine diphosphokinase [Chloroflexota bacterium]